jgi:hypothetical protein
MLAPADEHWHPPTTHTHWNESFYFNVFDADTGWACAVRVGATPNAGAQDGFVCLYLPDSTTGFIRASEPFEGNSSRIAARGIEVRCLDPLRKWQVRYDGPIHRFGVRATDDDIRRTLDANAPTQHLQLEFQLDSLHPPVDYDKRTVRGRPFRELFHATHARHPLRSLKRTLRTLGALPAMMKANHYEQSGKARGTLALDGNATEIAGFGQRDHSWGVRDMRAPANWRWLSCQFGAELCFNATQVDVLGMRVQGGFVLYGGVTEALESWRYEAKHSSSYWPDTLDVVLTAKSGAQFALEVEVTTPLPVIATTEDEDVLVTAARANYRWGSRTAVGMVEFMEQLR